MPVDVRMEIIIQRELSEVAAYAADPRRAPEWYTIVDEIEWEDDAQLEVGTKVAFVSHQSRRKQSYLFEVSEYVPEARLVMRATGGSYPMETTYTWEAYDQGSTKMTLRNRGEPTGLLALIAPLLAPAMRRSIRIDLQRLKRLLERGQANNTRLTTDRT